MIGDASDDRFPIRVYREDERWFVDWCRLGENRFTDPFFEQTVPRCLRPFNLAFRKQDLLDDLEEMPATSAPIAGAIFHLSRCGSTLCRKRSPRCRKTSYSPRPDRSMKFSACGDTIRA